MPLKAGRSQEIFSKNVSDMLHKYKATGRMSKGRIKPKSPEHARRIALAAAFSQKREYK